MFQDSLTPLQQPRSPLGDSVRRVALSPQNYEDVKNMLQELDRQICDLSASFGFLKESDLDIRRALHEILEKLLDNMKRIRENASKPRPNIVGDE